MKRALVLITMIVGLAVFSIARAVDTKPEDKVASLMKKKLQHSQKVLEGIALNDFKMIEKNADELMLISKATEWRVLKTPRYQLYSNQFRRVIQTLIKNAKEKNLDAAALTYVDLTLTCVNCHKHVREVRMTHLPLELPPMTDQIERSTP